MEFKIDLKIKLLEQYKINMGQKEPIHSPSNEKGTEHDLPTPTSALKIKKPKLKG